jgi:hypothetical protein
MGADRPSISAASRRWKSVRKCSPGTQALRYLKRFRSVACLNGHVHQLFFKTEVHADHQPNCATKTEPAELARNQVYYESRHAAHGHLDGHHGASAVKCQQVTST